MKRTIIFANGEINPPYPDQTSYLSGDLFIAADGGAAHCARLGITPHVVIGDFDSLPLDEVDALARQGTQVIQHPPHKDETDLELALLHAVNQGTSQIIIYGALGARWDMSLANLMLLTHPAFQRTKLDLIDGNQEINLIRTGETLEIHGQKGDTVSLIPLSPVAQGITSTGLEYPLSNGVLTMGSPRGVSNVMLSTSCQIYLEDGLLAIVHLRQVAL